MNYVGKCFNSLGYSRYRKNNFVLSAQLQKKQTTGARTQERKKTI